MSANIEEQISHEKFEGNFLDFLEEAPREFGPVEHDIYAQETVGPEPRLPIPDVSKYEILFN